MTDKMRDRVGQSILTVVISLIFWVVTFSATNSREDGIKLNAKIDQKLDKSEFIDNLRTQEETTRLLLDRTARTDENVQWIKAVLDKGNNEKH